MSRKIYWLIAILAVLALALVACGGEEPTATPKPAEPTATPEPKAEEPTPVPEEPAGPCAPATDGPLAGVDPRGVEVVWWHNHSGSREEALMPLVEQFNDTNECGITVVAQNQGGYNDIRDKMNAGIATGELPGLIVGYQNDQAFYALADGLADMNAVHRRRDLGSDAGGQGRLLPGVPGAGRAPGVWESAIGLSAEPVDGGDVLQPDVAGGARVRRAADDAGRVQGYGVCGGRGER